MMYALWIVLVIATCVVASGKGRNAYGWAVLGAFLPGIALAIVAILPAVGPPQLKTKIKSIIVVTALSFVVAGLVLIADRKEEQLKQEQKLAAEAKRQDELVKQARALAKATPQQMIDMHNAEETAKEAAKKAELDRARDIAAQKARIEDAKAIEEAAERHQLAKDLLDADLEESRKNHQQIYEIHIYPQR